MDVYIVSVDYQYDVGDIEVYAKKETAIDAADQLLYELQHDGYQIDWDYGDQAATFSDLSVDDCISIPLVSENGNALIAMEKKTIR